MQAKSVHLTEPSELCRINKLGFGVCEHLSAEMSGKTTTSLQVSRYTPHPQRTCVGVGTPKSTFLGSQSKLHPYALPSHLVLKLDSS